MNFRFLYLIPVFLLFSFLFNFSCVHARSYEVTSSCGLGWSSSSYSPDWPSVTAPACSLDYEDYFYADRSSQGTTPVPADYDPATSDPWISSVSAEVWYHSSGYDGTIGCFRGNGTVFQCATRSNNAGTSKDFYFRDDSGAAIQSIHASSSSSGKFWWFSCAYRICVEKGPCEKSTAPDCSTPPDPCLEGPGECFVDSTGSAACSYDLNTSYACPDIDSNECTMEKCVLDDEYGTDAHCEAGMDVCSGLIPCGRIANDPSTTWNDTDSCSLCYGIILLSRIINFIMSLVAIISVLAIVIVGLLTVTSSASTDTNVMIRKRLGTVLWGFVIVFIAWVIVNFIMVVFGYSDPLGNGAWHVFDCTI